MRSPFLKGAILCDEGSLGKSIEALLIISERFYEGKNRILIVVPTPLLHQWTKIMDSKFSIPFVMLDSNTLFDEQIKEGRQNPFDQEGVIITTYDFAAEQADYISQITWNMSVFDEAHHLRRVYTGENKGAAVIREAVGDCFKLLLTPTPMQNSIMDLYGLIYFIDETALPDADTFYKQYFRKPENYGELADRISKFCFRTMRTQVATYVKIPERIPMTIDFALSDKEQQLQDMLDAYLVRAKKYAFPKMELYDLTLMLTRLLSSSTFAFAKTLKGIERRLAIMTNEKNKADFIDEHNHVQAMLALANRVTKNAKGAELLNALKKGFVELKRLGANKKALIFTENRETQKYLYDMLSSNGYKGKVLRFNGDYSRDYTIMEKFEKSATILITTDIAAEGFNLEFCSFVINYDLPYNTLMIEQRINRCHRQGQQTDVLVINFLNRNNFADVRMLELINKRILQYDGIIGLSDDVIGNLGVNLDRDFVKIMSTAKSKSEIDKAFDEVLADYEAENKKMVKQAEKSLYTLFDKDTTDNLVVSPQYLQQRIDQANDDLWALTKYFFGKKMGFSLDDDTRTLKSQYFTPPKVFTGVAMRRREYSMQKGYQPASGRLTLTSSIARSIISELFWIGFPDSGSITVDAAGTGQNHIEQCEIGYYRIIVKHKENFWDTLGYDVFVGKTTGGNMLTHDECADIMALPVASFDSSHDIFGERNGISKRKRSHEFDRLIDTDLYIKRALSEMDGAVQEEIKRLKTTTQDRKIALERKIETLRNEVKALINTTDRANSIAEKIQAEKRKTVAQKELKQREQQLFLDGMRLDVELEEQITKLTDDMKFTAVVERQFVTKVEGK